MKKTILSIAVLGLLFTGCATTNNFQKSEKLYNSNIEINKENLKLFNRMENLNIKVDYDNFYIVEEMVENNININKNNFKISKKMYNEQINITEDNFKICKIFDKNYIKINYENFDIGRQMIESNINIPIYSEEEILVRHFKGIYTGIATGINLPFNLFK